MVGCPSFTPTRLAVGLGSKKITLWRALVAQFSPIRPSYGFPVADALGGKLLNIFKYLFGDGVTPTPTTFYDIDVNDY